MNTRKFSITLLLAVASLPLSAQPVQFDDYQKVVLAQIKDQIKALTKEDLHKGEFETTAEFEARKQQFQAPQLASLPYTFRVEPGANPFRELFSYDADAATMRGHLPFRGGKFVDIHASSDKDSYTATNGFGAGVTVQRTRTGKYGIKLPTAPEEAVVAVHMDPAQARTIKSHLRMGFRCLIKAGTEEEKISWVFQEATFSSPVDNFETGFYLPATLTEVFMYDDRDNSVVGSQPIQ